MPLGLIELLFFFGVVLAWALWELWSVRSSRDPAETSKRDEDGEENGSEAKNKSGVGGPDEAIGREPESR